MRDAAYVIRGDERLDEIDELTFGNLKWEPSEQSQTGIFWHNIGVACSLPLQFWQVLVSPMFLSHLPHLLVNLLVSPDFFPHWYRSSLKIMLPNDITGR